MIAVTIEIRSQITLDQTWVDAILITAFDRNYGGCWYWIREDFPDVGRSYEYGEAGEDGDKPVLSVTFTQIDLDQIRDFRPEVVDPRERSARLDLEAIQWACNLVLSDDHLQRVDTGKQLHRAVEYAFSYPEEAPDLDAEAADVLVQLALFGEVVYG